MLRYLAAALDSDARLIGSDQYLAVEHTGIHESGEAAEVPSGDTSFFSLFSLGEVDNFPPVGAFGPGRRLISLFSLRIGEVSASFAPDGAFGQSQRLAGDLVFCKMSVKLIFPGTSGEFRT